MCEGVAVFANNKRALYAKKTVSHDKGATELRINGDQYRKFEYLWWEKELNQVHYDSTAEGILAKINEKKAFQLARRLVKKHFKTQKQLVTWLKEVPAEWDKLLEPKFKNLAKKVNPKLVIYQEKIAKFKETPIEKYNPYQATKLPALKEIKKHKKLAQVRDQVRDQVGDQVWDQVWAQVGAQVGAQVWAQVWAQVGAQVRDQVRDQVRAQVGDQVGDQVWAQVWAQVGAQVGAQVRAQVWAQVWAQVGDQVWAQVRAQVWAQVWAISYWAIKVVLGLPIKHWFFDFLRLGVIIVFLGGKVKVFGKKGKFLGEYEESDFFKPQRR